MTAEHITKRKLLVVEGKDEIVFFEELFKHIGMVDTVELREVGGKDQFKKDLPALKIATGFNKLETIAVIRDADESFEGAFESIRGILNKMGFRTPGRPGEFSPGTPRVGIFIMPDNANQGMLENLCLDTVKDDEAMKCVNQFIDCSQKLKKKPRNIHKARAHAFLSVMPEIANSVGRGAQKGHWDFDSTKLKPLIKFIGQLN
ncbi:MAG: hypothetical protein GY950_17655 [bacterium]|nr:hypothetical protein [bacterium]